MIKTLAKSAPVGSEVFDHEVQVAVHALRSGLADLLLAVGADPLLPQEVSRRFGLDKNLTWKVSRVLKATDAAAAVPHMPGRAGMKILLQTLAQAGAPADRILAAQSALEAFEQVVRTHGGDRRTFESMLNSSSPVAAIQQAQSMRRLSFQGNSGTWGVQARVQISAGFVGPSSDDPERLDLAVVCGLADFRRLRPDVPWALTTLQHVTDDGSVRTTDRYEPVDDTGTGEVPLLREFCSQPLPNVRAVPIAPNVTRIELAEGPIGNAGVCTCVLAWIFRRAVPRFASENDKLGEHSVTFSTPVELAFHDLFVHQDLDFALNPQINIYNQLPAGPIYPKTGRDRGILPVPESMQRLGSPPDLVIPELPSYPQMIRRVLKKLGWSENAAHGFRLKLAYPPIPAKAVYRHGLPTRP